MRRFLQGLRSRPFWPVLVGALLTVPTAGSAQELAKRLILQNGSYQMVTQWEIKGDRVRYLSAERNEWEEIPKVLVDWPATDKYEKERAAGAPAPEAVELDKELAAERAADEVRTPHVAPGLRLPEDGGVVLLDTFENQPQLVDLDQNGGEINKNTKGNILRAAINPIASAKQTIELQGLHAKIQAHVMLPAIYVNVEQQDKSTDASIDASGRPSDRPTAGHASTRSSGDEPQQPQGPQEPQGPQQAQGPQQPWDRFRIVRMETKQGKRIVGDIKIAAYGKVSQEGKYVDTTAERLTGGWVKVTPTSPLTVGEYAVVESMGTEGMNLYVWDFGVNPAAPSNVKVWKVDPSGMPTPDQMNELEKR